MVTRVKISQKKAGACDVRHRCDGANVERKNPTHRTTRIASELHLISRIVATTRPDFDRSLSHSAGLWLPTRSGRKLTGGIRRRGHWAGWPVSGKSRTRPRGRGASIQGCRMRLETGSRVMRHSGEGMGDRMNKAFVCSATLPAALLIFGCTASMLSEAEQQSLAAAATAAPKLQPGDKIRVNVFGEDKLSGDYEIDQSGQISLPLAGTVEALGLTQAELEQALAKKF